MYLQGAGFEGGGIVDQLSSVFHKLSIYLSVI